MTKRAKTVSVTDLRVGDEILQDHGQDLACRTYRVLREVHEPIPGAVYLVRHQLHPHGNSGIHYPEFVAYYLSGRWEFMGLDGRRDAYDGGSGDGVVPLRLLWALDGSHLPEKRDTGLGNRERDLNAGYNKALADVRVGKGLT